MALEEWRQVKTYLEDATQEHKPDTKGWRQTIGRLAGLGYYLTFHWNWVDLMSCVLVLVIITPLHLISMFHVHVEDFLASFVAIESILAFAKVWYFAQPFQNTGPVVRMIYSIVWDSSIFLGLAFIVMIGFGVGMPALFRKPSGTEDEVDDVMDSFGRFDNSLETLFFALVGNFQPTVYRSAGNLSALATVIFILYLLTQMILLLNLLISIMGDTFDRVKGSEEAHLLMGRAHFIDACEAALGKSGCKKIDEGIGKYLHVLMEVGAEFDRRSPTEWTGKLEKIETNCKIVIKSSEDNIKSMLQIQNDNMSSLEKHLKHLRESLFRAPKEDEEEITHSTGRIDALEERLEKVELNVSNSLETINEMFEFLKNARSP